MASDQLPLVRALAGIPTEAVEMVINNPRIPRPARVEANGRPLRGPSGNVVGGGVTFRDITKLRAAQERLAELALTDEMTGLPNLRAFRSRLEQLVHESDRGRRFALVMVDVDHFKKVNDTHGHDVGDQVLRAMARTLRHSVRKVDLVARYGGEEVCVLYVDVDDATAFMLAERLRTAVAGIDDPLAVTCSLGVCAHTGERNGLDGDMVLRAADAALYSAKRSGRNRVVMCHGHAT
jgi:diguanylate cyclase (GGDEF)-like protein